MMLPPLTLLYIPKLNLKLTPGQWLNKKIKNTVTNVDAADNNASHNAMNTTPYAPNAATAPDA